MGADSFSPNKDIKTLTAAIEITIKKCSEHHKVYTKILELIFKNKLTELSDQFKKSFPAIKESISLPNYQLNMKALITKIFEETDEIDKKLFASLFGAFLGDAMGAFCEFSQASPNNKNLIFQGQSIFGKDAGTVTDDSEMAMSMAFGIMDNPSIKEIKSEYNYFYYGWWYKSGPADIGNATRAALRLFDPNSCDPSKEYFNDRVYKILKTVNEGSKANGFLMRFSPFIVWFYVTFEYDIKKIYTPEGKIDSTILNTLYLKAKKESANDNNCTHTNKELCIASAIFTIAGVAAINGKNSNQIVDILKAILQLDSFQKDAKYDEKTVGSMVAYCLENYAIDNPNKITAVERFTKKESVYERMGYYGHAFKLTLYYLINWNSYTGQPNVTPYRRIMEEIMNFGGDTDTNAAIVGAVLGPLLGMENIGPNDLQTMLNAFDKDRIVYSPPLMYFYVKLMRQNQSNLAPPKKGMFFLRMILHLLFENVNENPNLFTNILKYE